MAAGVVFPSSLALLVQEFHGAARRRAIGMARSCRRRCAATCAAYDAAYGGAVDRLLLVTAGVALTGAVLALALIRQRDLLAQPAPAG